MQFKSLNNIHIDLYIHSYLYIIYNKDTKHGKCTKINSARSLHVGWSVAWINERVVRGEWTKQTCDWVIEREVEIILYKKTERSRPGTFTNNRVFSTQAPTLNSVLFTQLLFAHSKFFSSDILCMYMFIRRLSLYLSKNYPVHFF